MSQPARENRLAQESSPYLLQHAANPVDWYPWGREALEKARAEDKPIFLSIGYAACHWCHVMEHESFESERIAGLLDRSFVAVKVDREERPDIDEIYMQAVQAMTGRGGWPLSVFLTPEGRPFWGGTYFPPEDRGGMPGFDSVLEGLARAWAERREEVESNAEELTRALRQGLQRAPGRGGSSWAELLESAARDLEARFDTEWGGWGTPKFPHCDAVVLLLRHARRTGEPRYARLALRTLEAMDRGGIHDQVGGGFHRYAVDQRWLVPHFEKMLYDQALVAQGYLEAWIHEGGGEEAERWARPLRGICDWVLRDMRDEGGAFHASLDADSQGEEGRFYVWSPEEAREVLERAGISGESIEACLRWYGLDGPANFEGESWILYRPRTLQELATLEDIEDPASWPSAVSRCNEALRAHREQRPWPGRDDKVVCGWNGLMIGVLAGAGAALEEPRYVQAAAEAARFVLRAMRPEGRLVRSWRGGEAKVPAFLEDHAYLARGLLDLHEATGEEPWLQEACALAAETLERFWDEEEGGFWFTGEGAEPLVVRSKAVYDGATPAGASVMAEVLLRLGEETGRELYPARARATLRLQQAAMEKVPAAYSSMLQAVERMVEGGLEDPGSEEASAAEAVPEDHGGRPELEIEARAEGPMPPGGTVGVEIDLGFEEGWYAPAPDAGGTLRPARLATSPAAEGWRLEEVAWPEIAASRELPGVGSVPVLEGRVRVQAVLHAPDDAEATTWDLPLVLHVQLCGEGRCLPPDERVVPLRVEVVPGT